MSFRYAISLRIFAVRNLITCTFGLRNKSIFAPAALRDGFLAWSFSVNPFFLFTNPNKTSTKSLSALSQVPVILSFPCLFPYAIVLCFVSGPLSRFLLPKWSTLFAFLFSSLRVRVVPSVRHGGPGPDCPLPPCRLVFGHLPLYPR